MSDITRDMIIAAQLAGTEATEKMRRLQVIAALKAALRETEDMLLKNGPTAINWDWYWNQLDLLRDYQAEESFERENGEGG